MIVFRLVLLPLWGAHGKLLLYVLYLILLSVILIDLMKHGVIQALKSLTRPCL